MKEFLKKLLENKRAKQTELKNKLETTEDVNEARALSDSLTALAEEIRGAEEQLANLENSNGAGAGNDKGLNPLASYGMRGTNPVNDDMEKRLAFANYVVKGVLPEEMRANAITNTGNVSVAIPQNLLPQILTRVEEIGMVLSLVTRTAYPVGQTILSDGVKPVATWVNEGAGSDKQAKTGMGSITFSAHKLRCEIAFTQEVSVQTIPAFEALFVRQVSEAMVKAIEGKIVSADSGTASNAGILYRASGSDKAVTIAKLATGKLTYKTLCDAEALLPQEYEGSAKWFMSKKTFMSFVAMTDEGGQPISRVNYGIGGKPERTLLGRDVVLTGTYLPDYTEATATEDVTFAFLFNPADYVLNTSYDLGIQSKQDWDNENHCVKAVMSVDGKVIDRNSLVKLVKAYQ